MADVLQQKVRYLLDDRAQLLARIDELQSSLAAARQENAKLSEEQDKNSNWRASLQTQLDAADQLAAQQRAAILSRQAQLSQAREEISRMDETFSSALSVAQRTIAEQASALAAARAAHDADLDRMLHQSTQLSRAAASLDASAGAEHERQLAVLRNRIGELESREDTQHNALASVRRELAQRAAEFEQVRTTLSHKVRALLESLQAARDQNASLAESLEAAEALVSLRTTERDEARDACATLLAALDSAKGRSKRLQAQLTDTPPGLGLVESGMSPAQAQALQSQIDGLEVLVREAQVELERSAEALQAERATSLALAEDASVAREAVAVAQQRLAAIEQAAGDLEVRFDAELDSELSPWAGGGGGGGGGDGDGGCGDECGDHDEDDNNDNDDNDDDQLGLWRVPRQVVGARAVDAMSAELAAANARVDALAAELSRVYEEHDEEFGRGGGDGGDDDDENASGGGGGGGGGNEADNNSFGLQAQLQAERAARLRAEDEAALYRRELESVRMRDARLAELLGHE